MKITKIKEEQSKSISASLTGYIDIDYESLIKTFGEPELIMDDKGRVEWILKVGDIIFTIYDYRDFTPFDRMRNWHIGSDGWLGSNQKESEFVIIKSALLEVLPEAKVTSFEDPL